MVLEKLRQPLVQEGVADWLQVGVLQRESPALLELSLPSGPEFAGIHDEVPIGDRGIPYRVDAGAAARLFLRRPPVIQDRQIMDERAVVRLGPELALPDLRRLLASPRFDVGDRQRGLE